MRTKLEQISETLDQAKNTNGRPPQGVPHRRERDQPRHATRHLEEFNSTKETLRRLSILMGVLEGLDKT